MQRAVGAQIVKFGQGRRHLWLALSVSVLLHVALLAPWAAFPRVRLTVATQALQARIHATDQRPKSSAAMADAPADLQRSTGSLSGRRPHTGLRDASSAPANARPGAQRGSWASAATDTTPMPTVAPTAPNGVSADELRQYRMALAIAARRFKHYPLVAREGGWEGRVDVALSASAGQGMPRASLVRSSGFRALDEQALSMVEQAAAVTLLPEGLHNAEFRVLLPIEFSLDAVR